VENSPAPSPFLQISANSEITELYPRFSPSGYEAGALLSGKYRIGGKIGSGRHGTVYHCSCSASGTQLAVKVISQLSPAARATAERERLIFSHILSNGRELPHINSIVEIFETAENTNVVQEVAHGGDLWRLVRRHGKISEHQARIVMRGVFYAVNSCHQAGIVHSDLKLENFVLGTRGVLESVRLIDFGTAELVTESNSLHPLGSIEYMAPERKAWGSALFDSPLAEQRLAGDIYSAGVVMYVLLFGIYPDMQQIESESWSEISAEAQALLKRMMHVNPNSRPTVVEILQNEWLFEEHAEEVVTTADENPDSSTDITSSEVEESPCSVACAQPLTGVERSFVDEVEQLRRQGAESGAKISSANSDDSHEDMKADDPPLPLLPPLPPLLPLSLGLPCARARARGSRPPPSHRHRRQSAEKLGTKNRSEPPGCARC
jgi:serine/threonine protein kinase